MHDVLLFSDAIGVATFGFFGVGITTVGVVIVAFINRSTKQEARSATSGVVEVAELLADALKRVTLIEGREDDCLEALQWAHNRIAVIEAHTGMPRSEPPHPLRRPRAR